jgi:drug/metabolite transporter (DMT)-like permease
MSRASLKDWAAFALLVAIGGSSFAFIEIAIETIPPPAVTVGRLWVAAVFLYAAMRAAGERLPPLRDGHGAIHRAWSPVAGVSLIGYVIPFFIFPWAQQSVESGLAGVYMAFMPLATLALARLFADERLTRWNAAGFALGFLGVLILMGPEAASGVSSSSALAQAGLLVATLCYAISVVITRRAPELHPRVFACASVLGAAFLSTPALVVAPPRIGEWSLAGAASVVMLGLAQTGLAAILIFALIRRVGAGFMSLANYLTPLCAVLVGAVAFGERLGAHALIALALTLFGVALSRR